MFLHPLRNVPGDNSSVCRNSSWKRRLRKMCGYLVGGNSPDCGKFLGLEEACIGRWELFVVIGTKIDCG